MSPYEIIMVILQTDMVVISAIALVLNGIKKDIPEECPELVYLHSMTDSHRFFSVYRLIIFHDQLSVYISTRITDPVCFLYHAQVI